MRSNVKFLLTRYVEMERLGIGSIIHQNYFAMFESVFMFSCWLFSCYCDPIQIEALNSPVFPNDHYETCKIL